MKFSKGTIALTLAACALVTIALAGRRPAAPDAGLRTAGDGAVATENRPVAAGITAVALDGPINLTLRQGPQPALAVRAEARLLPNIATDVDGDRLRIAPRGMLLHPRQPIDVTLTLPRLATLRIAGSGASTASGFAGEHLALALDGAGNLRFDGRYASAVLTLRGSGALDYAGGAAERIVLDASGSGAARLTGSARDLHATLLGAGELDAGGLPADEVTLVQKGSGNSHVTARGGVSIDMRGSGDVIVAGQPARRQVQRQGSGEVVFAE